jgi:hypothetical protein
MKADSIGMLSGLFEIGQGNNVALKFLPVV